MPSQIYGSKIFVGREKEIAEFEQVLNSPEASQWILNVYGPGGIGKTQLLHKFVETIEERKVKGENLLVTKEFVDLYWTENRRTLGMLKNIADQLSPELFTGFYTELDKYNKLLSQQFLTESSLLHEQEERAKSTFFEIYKSLSFQQIVLIFDTTELASEAAFSLWQSFSSLTIDPHCKTLLVLAGRKRFDNFIDEDCKWLSVSGLSVNQVKNYFESLGMDLPLGIVEKVAELSKGRPILIALTVDWLRFGRLPDNLMKYTPEEFEQAMVERIQQLQFPEDQLVLAMAHFYRRFDEQLLSYILKNIFSKSPDNVIKQIESLSKYSFIKYRPAVGDKPGSCTLHDEMRDLVKKYIWDILDPRKEERGRWSRLILAYYADKIDSQQEQSERQNLCLERLFYWFDVDVHQAFDYSRQLTEDALYRFNFRYIKAINVEFEEKEALLDPGERNELALRQAAVLHREGKTQEAKQITNALPDDSDLSRNPVLLFAWLIEFYADSGDPGKAFDINVKYDLEQELKRSIDRVTGEEQKPYERALGTLYNNLGYAASRQSRMNAAVENYEKALEHFLKAGEAHAQIARTRNNLGFVLHRLGRDEEALSHCEIAFKLRQCLPNQFEVGLSYNVIGQIYADLLRVDESISCFEKAIQAFGEANSDRGKAMAYTAYGCLLRQLGWYREDFAQEAFDPDRKEYSKASKMLDDAIYVFKRQSDISNLCEALNEKGTLLRQQRKWEEALASYDESIAFAENIDNSYRKIDNLQDKGILYEFWGNKVSGDLKKEYALYAMENAKQASELAWKNNSFYLYARAQRTMGEALFNLEMYEEAFECAANACMYVVRPDPSESRHSSAKTNLVYDKFEDWTGDLILRLPEQKMAEKMCDYLITCWMEQEQMGRRLADLYPGFISKIKSLKTDYPLLKSAGKRIGK